MEYLLVRDQMLWLGNVLPNSLINPNQLHASGLDVNDDPFNLTHEFGIDSEHEFIHFDTMGTIAHFESQCVLGNERKHTCQQY